MDIKLRLPEETQKRESITEAISFSGTKKMKSDIRNIKNSSIRNKKLINEFARQFFAQLVDKFGNGDFEKEPAQIVI